MELHITVKGKTINFFFPQNVSTPLLHKTIKREIKDYTNKKMRKNVENGNMWSDKNEENNEIIQRIDRYIELLTEENRQAENILTKSRYRDSLERGRKFAVLYQDVYDLTSELDRIKEDRFRLEKLLRQ